MAATLPCACWGSSSSWYPQKFGEARPSSRQALDLFTGTSQHSTSHSEGTQRRPCLSHSSISLATLAPLALYHGDRYVRSVRSFTDIGPSSSNYVVLEFFAGWCGHCQAFAPTWKETSRQACAAAPGLQFGAVDCVADYLLCQEMRIGSYPTLRLFGPELPEQGGELAACPHGCDSSAQRKLRTSGASHSTPCGGSL